MSHLLEPFRGLVPMVAGAVGCRQDTPRLEAPFTGTWEISIGSEPRRHQEHRVRYPEPDETERERIPEPILSQLTHLMWVVVEVDSIWSLVDQIFGEKEDVALLRQASGYGYRVIYDALVENCILCIARLTDPPRTSGKNNLTFPSISEVIASSEDELLSQRTNSLLQELTGSVEGCRQYRNKILAHNDRQIALDRDAQPVVQIQEINDFISNAQELIAVIREHYEVMPFCFDMLVGADASGIVKSLRELERFRDLRKKAIRNRVSDTELRRELQRIRPI